MKQGRTAGIILAVINMILITVCIVCWLRTDRTEPEMEFQALTVVYREGMDNAKLLEGVTASDDKDGDVTDRVVIEKIVEDRQENQAVVFYAVSDKAGNVEKASRVFEAAFSDQFFEAGINAELKGEDTDWKDTSENTEQPQNQEEAVSPAPLPSGTPEEETEPTPMKTPEQEPLKTPEPTPQKTPEPTPKPKPTVDPSVPVLTLKMSEVKVNAGQGPAWVDIIGTLKDDKDNYETLFKNLSVSKYNKDKAGTYQVTVSTEDSDGNRSNAVPLTIIVK